MISISLSAILCEHALSSDAFRDCVGLLSVISFKAGNLTWSRDDPTVLSTTDSLLHT